MSLSTRALFVLLSMGASAADPPPEPPTSELAIAHMGSPVGGVRLGSLHLIFENSTLSDVQRSAAELGARFLPMERNYPALARWIERIEALPGYERTYPPHWRGA